MRRIVIVGGGLAGHRAAETLLAGGFEGELIVVGDEVHAPYDRPPLSKQLLAGTIEQDACFFSAERVESVAWKLGAPASGLDLAANEVELANGERVPYDGLIIATGRRARELSAFTGREGVHTLRTLGDSSALAAAVRNDLRVAIVGAGFIGCEVAATLRGAGVDEVSVIDVAPHPMPVLGEAVGERAADIHTSHGVKLYLGTGVDEIVGEGRVEALVLGSGERLPADLVLVAVGSAPNSEWLEGSGLELRQGTVLCDEHCYAVGTENVVAAGDIASWPHPAAGPEPVWVEHWSNARDMGVTAAANLLAAPGERTPYVAVPTFWSDQYNVKIKSAGFLKDADISIVEEDLEAEKPSLVAEAHRDGRLAGAIVFNKNRRIIEYQRELAEQGNNVPA